MTTSAMDRIPYEVWEEIIEHLPSSDMPPAMALNRATYNIVLDNLYRAIHWRCLDENMVKSLICLRDPSIAARVRKLSLETLETIVVDGERKLPSWLRVKATQVAVNLSRRRSRSVSIRSEVQAFKATINKAKHVLEAMREVFVNMTRLEECVIITWPILRRKSMEHPARPLLTMCAMIGSNLRLLILHGSANDLSTWITSARMERLEELLLSVSLWPVNFGFEHHEDQIFVASRLASFINSVSPSLRRLQISFSCELDLSDFFNALTVIPRLRHLLLQTSLYSTFQSNPDALFEFLIAKIPRHCVLHLVGIDPGDYIRRLISTKECEESAHMELNISYRSEDINFDIITTLIQRLGNMLGSVHLYQYSLSIPQFEALTTMMSKSNGNITMLHLQVPTLSPAIFDFLSLHMPELVSLSLVYEELYASDTGSDGDNPDDDPRLTAFLRAMVPGRYRDWALRNIRVCELKFETEDVFYSNDTVIMVVMHRAAPRVRTVRGCKLSAVLEKIGIK